VVDVQLMDCESTTEGDPVNPLRLQAGITNDFKAVLSDDRLWLGKSGDEDPDFVYDREKGKWFMTICRGVKENGRNQYRYFLFESDEPFAGYKFRDCTLTGANTGGSIFRVGGRYYFACGSNFNVRAQYNIYDLNDFSKYEQVKCDFDDGGFRGWGTIIPVPCGNRTKYMWMTFDRHGGSSYNWSYGNIYVYESDLMNSGYERGIKYNL